MREYIEKANVNETLTVWTAVSSLFKRSHYRACALRGRMWK